VGSITNVNISYLVSGLSVGRTKLLPTPSMKRLLISVLRHCDRLCGLVIRVLGYRPRGPRFDSRDQLSLVRINEELVELKNRGSGLENREIHGHGDSLS
jgi:hypothetical protein